MRVKGLGRQIFKMNNMLVFAWLTKVRQPLGNPVKRVPLWHTIDGMFTLLLRDYHKRGLYQSWLTVILVHKSKESEKLSNQQVSLKTIYACFYDVLYVKVSTHTQLAYCINMLSHYARMYTDIFVYKQICLNIHA